MKRIEVGTRLLAKTDLYWSDGNGQHLHFKKGDAVVVDEIVLSAVGLSTLTGPLLGERIVPHIFVRKSRGPRVLVRQTIGDKILEEYEI
jgi:hypothetical protein